MKKLIILFSSMLACAAMGSSYYGTFTGNGSGLTNVTGTGTATNLAGAATNQVAVISTNTTLGLTTPISALGNAAAPLTMTNAVVTSWSTNTLTVTATGVTNNSTTNNFLVSVTAGTGLAVKDSNGTQFLTPVLNNTFPLKPGQGFTGTAVTAIAVQDP